VDVGDHEPGMPAFFCNPFVPLHAGIVHPNAEIVNYKGLAVDTNGGTLHVNSSSCYLLWTISGAKPPRFG